MNPPHLPASPPQPPRFNVFKKTKVLRRDRPPYEYEELVGRDLTAIEAEDMVDKHFSSCIIRQIVE